MVDSKRLGAVEELVGDALRTRGHVLFTVTTASMEPTIRQGDQVEVRRLGPRRYRRLVREERAMPDLILIDGGKGQLAAAHGALEESGAPPVAMAALAKREEEIYLLGRRTPLRLERSSAALRLLQQVRDEAHRFAVTYHRKLRSKRQLTSELHSIHGVGRVRAALLLRQLGSLEKVKKAGFEELACVVPRGVAQAVREHFDLPGSKK